MKKLNMKKTTAAAIAATVGAVLLLGGAGTLAYWSDEETTGAQTITAGSLVLDSVTDGTWVHAGTSDSVSTIVPGDTIETTISVPVALTGDNLEAELTVSRTLETSTFDANDLTVTTVVDGTPGTTATVTDEDTAVEVVITIAFDKGLTIDNDDMNASTSFALEYVLTQQ